MPPSKLARRNPSATLRSALTRASLYLASATGGTLSGFSFWQVARIVCSAFSRSAKPWNSEVDAKPLAVVSMCSEWPWPGVSLNRFAFVILLISARTRSCFLPKAPIKHKCCDVTCSCPGWLPSEHENLPSLSVPSGRLKFLISFSGRVLRSSVKSSCSPLFPGRPPTRSPHRPQPLALAAAPSRKGWQLRLKTCGPTSGD